jgi:hypothetical protein
MRAVVSLAFLLVLALAAPADGARITGWNGENPFVCELQQAGFEATGSDPAADPYCVEFDKRRQNISELGLVDFLAKEPARVAAATDKCFYFQADHWRASVIQDDGSTKLYEWDGHYFFDKARGEGGAWVTNFNVNGRTEDPSRYPGIPPEYAQHMGMGTGGVRVVDGSVEPDPRCAERARREPERIYVAAQPGGPPSRFATDERRCRAPSRGYVTSRSLGPVRIGDGEARVRDVLGPPAEVRRGFLRHCAAGQFLAGNRTDRSGDLGAGGDEPTVMIVARQGAFRLHGTGPGSSERTLRRNFARRLQRMGVVAGTRVHRVRRRPVAFGTRRGQVRWIAVFDTRVIRTREGLEIYLRRALSG